MTTGATKLIKLTNNYFEMNYENEYKFYYDKFYSKIENRIKKYYIEQSNKEMGFGTIHNELAQFLFNDLGRTIYLNSNDDLKELLKKFNSRYARYKKNETNHVVENDIKPAFDKLNKETFPLNYCLEKLLIQIALINSKNEIGRLLHNNNGLFKLFYELNEFDNFEIKDYNGISIENTEIFKSLNQKKYPDLYNSQNDNLYEEYEKETNGLDTTQKILLIEKLIKNAHKWETTDERKKGFIISKIIDRNSDNIRKILAKSDKKPSEHKKKFIDDIAIADEIINKLG